MAAQVAPDLLQDQVGDLLRGTVRGPRWWVLSSSLGVTRSMGAVGTGADNALAESFNAALKREPLQGAARWDTAVQTRLAVFAWITRYNTRRRRSYCGHLSPSTYEKTRATVTLLPAA